MIDFFLHSYRNASILQIILELLAFVLGIWSVFLAKRVNILVYPTGLIATAITTYLLYVAGYLGDMLLNGYFSIMSLYGWYHWAEQSKSSDTKISRTTAGQKFIGFLLFFITIFVVFGVYKLFNYQIKTDNFLDILASGVFFTAMWFMALKKIENWTLWILGDLIVTPLYAYRGLGMLSLQYLIFTIIAVMAYLEWKKTLNNYPLISSE